MAINNHVNLDGVSTHYADAYKEVFVGDKPSDLIDMLVDRHNMGDEDILEIPFMDDAPEPRMWKGSKQFKSTSAARLRIDVEPYEKSTAIPITKWGNSSFVQAALKQFLASEKQYYEKLFADLLVTANSALGYDGVAFCSTSHVGPNGGTQTNYSTTAMSRAQVVSTVAAMRAYTTVSGTPLGVRPDTLIVGPKLEDDARDIVFGSLKSLDDTTAIDNQKPLSKLIVLDRLVGTYDDYWFVADSREGRRPLVCGIKEPPTPKDDVDQFKHGAAEHKFSLEAQLAVGLGLWQSIYGNFVA